MSNYCSQVGQFPIITETTPEGTDGTVDEQTSVTVLAAIISGDISVSQQGVNVTDTSSVAFVLFIL